MRCSVLTVGLVAPPLDPADVALVHAATLGELGLGETVLPPHGDDLERHVVDLLEDFALLPGLGGEAGAALGR